MFNDRLTPRVLQFGEGNFLRAFFDWMVQEVNETTGKHYGVIMVQPIEHGKVETLIHQQGAYHVILTGYHKGQGTRRVKEINCIYSALNPYHSFKQFLQSAEIPELDIVVSNTTEAGITFDAEDSPEERPAGSYPAKLLQWLYHRYTFFEGSQERGVQLYPCELIENNGDALRACILKYVDLWKLEASFVDWLDAACVFRNTLVDRIVPGRPELDEELLLTSGQVDEMVVEGEAYHSWVIDGGEPAEEVLPFRKAGINVSYTDSLSPFRARKVGILNGAHTMMVPLGLLAELEEVRHVMEDPELGPLIVGAIEKAAIPALPMGEKELLKYASEIWDRFRNPSIHHLLSSIALNSLSKYNTRVFPQIIYYHQNNIQLPEVFMLSLASLLVFYRGEYQGRLMPLQDDPALIAAIQRFWEHPTPRECVVRTLQMDHWKKDLSDWDVLVEGTVRFIRIIDEEGIRNAVRQVQI